jgi:hypothetical protein
MVGEPPEMTFLRRCQRHIGPTLRLGGESNMCTVAQR